MAVVLVIAGTQRREFLGDGVRHLPNVLSHHFQFGEPRWLLFPAVAQFWVRVWSSVGILIGPEPALRALAALSVASGVVFLLSLRAWLRLECHDERRCAAALLLACACAPFLVLFTDVAEPQVASAIAVGGLAFARVHRDDDERGAFAAGCAIVAIVSASLIYQAMILALGMLPLVVRTTKIGRGRMIVAVAAGVATLALSLFIAQAATGTPPPTALSAVVGGERNPLARSLMSVPSPRKYAAAALAGPPQGIVRLESYGGLASLLSSLKSSDPNTAAAAVTNLLRLALGFVVTAILVFRGSRNRQWAVLAAAAILLALPIARNQQYGYVKFYVLWPIPVALLAVRCRPRLIVVLSTLVLTANGWLIAGEISRGRSNYRFAREAYATATPSTCWMTSGWTPPFAYLWPGTSAPILGILSTGTRPAEQGPLLTLSLRKCLCDSHAVWTDTTTRDADVVRSLTAHFDYTAVDLPSVLADPGEATPTPIPGVVVYTDASRRRACGLISR